MCLLWRFILDYCLVHILLFINLLYLSSIRYIAKRRWWFNVGFIEVAIIVRKWVPSSGSSLVSLDFVIMWKWSRCVLLVTVEVIVRISGKFYFLVTFYISHSSVICTFLLECCWQSDSREEESAENFVKSVSHGFTLKTLQSTHIMNLCVLYHSHKKSWTILLHN